MEDKLIILEGIVSDIIYTNEDNGYTVIDLLTLEKNITAVGTLPYIYEGETLVLYGNYTVHNEYGEQFKVTTYERSMPKNRQSIINFLSSGLIKGIGPSTAKKIVDKFEEKSLEIIEREPETLAKIKGITEAKAIEISKNYCEKKSVQDIVHFLQMYDISINLAIKVHRALGSGAVGKIENNPFVLCEEVEGIGFKTSDIMATKMGISKNDIKRIKSGIKYSLKRAVLNGHTFLYEDMLISYAAKVLEVTYQEVQNALISLSINNELVKEVKDEKIVYYLSNYYLAEMKVADKLSILNLFKIKSLYKEHYILDIEKYNNIELADKQKNAIKTVLENNITIITGGPGTGKTTIINSIISIVKEQKLSVALTAPTGRAAKRMSEVCGQEAKTIHRLLEVNFLGKKEEERFVKNEENPIKTDILIVDEMSMVDIMLFNSLISAIKLGTRLVLVGDINQLPSVGAGNVLKDIINSNSFPCVYLDEIFRQEKESMIVTNAHRLLKGEYPKVNYKNSDFFMIRKNTSEEIIAEVSSLCKNRIMNFLSDKNDPAIQILSPMKKSVLGTINLNNELQKVLNPKSSHKQERKWGNYIFREGDKVIQTKNNYEITWTTNKGEVGEGIYNGDTGIIKSIQPKDEIITVVFYDGRIADYEFSKLEDLDLAYAITVHKSQGCEFDAVILPLLYGPETLLYNNLLYTAITRAKSLVVIVGGPQCVMKMIDNQKETERFTGLLDKLRVKNENI